MNARTLRRALYVSGGAVSAFLACVLLGLGLLPADAVESPTLAGISLVAGIIVFVVAVVARRVRSEGPTARAQRQSRLLAAAPVLTEIEMSLVLVLGAFTLLVLTGGLDSAGYPLLYGVVAFSATFQSRAGVWATVAGALALEGALVYHAGGGTDVLVTASAHVGFLGAAAAAHAVFLRGLVRRQRAEHRKVLASEIRSQRESARDYRLISPALRAESRATHSRMAEEHMLAVGGVQTISAAIYYNLQLLKRSLDARTCILLWLHDGGDTLKIKELVTDSDEVTEASEIRAGGVVGAIVHDRAPVLVAHARAGQVPYFESGESVGAVAGVPVLEGTHLRGVLCVDRDDPFGDRDIELVAAAAEQVVRAVQSELVFRSVERAKYEHERFYQASAMLCEALTIEQVLETAFDAAAQITEFDIAAISLFDADRNRHRVYSARVRPGAEHMVDRDKLCGLEYRTNSGLAAMVVKNRHYLPAGGEMRDTSTPIYTKKLKIKEAESVLVLPLLAADNAIGTFMLGSRYVQRFGKDVREMLRIIANQVAVSVQNAMMYRKMETMATTDGLTGLTNHRTFQDRFENLLERSARHGHRAAMLLCDVDHFKNVNDTYGHPVGDEVLRRVADVLRGAVRKIDIPARYGGEEFAVVLEATDLEGAMLLANRIREDVAALVLDSDQGTFQIAMSIGVSCFPDDSRERADLIERADLALYHAKESGRNQVVSYQQFVAARRARKAS